MPINHSPRSQSCPSRFNYLYRDAGNFKVHGSILLSGKLTNEQQAEIVMKLESEEFFIAEQVGLRPLYDALYEFSGGMTREDHVWHSFDGFEQVLNDSQIDDAEFWGTAAELLRRFRNVASWSLRRSRHWAAAA